MKLRFRNNINLDAKFKNTQNPLSKSENRQLHILFLQGFTSLPFSS